ncbi:MAG: EAL domain-containing protein [Firmicutes bacterium]|nr:EAL domain-containing protein [Bacillota bacterium]
MLIKILVVEDSATDRLIIKSMLSEYQILTACDGQEALRMLQEHDGINLMILDLNMPRMNGFQVLESLKGDKRYGKLRTIVLTNYDEVDNEIKGLKLGAVDYIRKPIHMESLKARIDVHAALLRAEHELEQQLHESERSKSVLLSHLPGLAYRCNYDRDWTMQYVSAGCYDLTGYPPESLLYNRDLSYNELISPEYHDVLWNEWERVLAAGQPFKYEYEIITAAGEKKWVLEMGQGIYNDAGEVEALEGIVFDISYRKAIEDALKYNYEHDRWTGLHNHDYLVALLEKDAKRKQKAKKALIGINLNMVQVVAANYGFQYAQNLIKKAAEALSQHCTDNCLLFHSRENSFVFYLFDYKDQKELVAFGNVIADTLGSIFITERIGGGIGILEIEQNQSELNVDLQLRRLLIASETSVSMFGRDFEICIYNEELEAIVNREREIVEALSAIAANDDTTDELFLQYQPIMNLRTGSIFGFEALGRLRTGKLGLVSPLEFIPIAEKTKLILPIGEKIIAKALCFLNRLNKLGYNEIGISLNISVIQLLSPNFTNRLFELISEIQVNMKNIYIEITESVFASDYDKINSILEIMRKAGLQIMIDDFGTGYSSLYREQELKADYMKIDKYFIDNLLCADQSKAITGDIISMAHKLGHCTIAEGVEHNIQLQYLQKHNCDKIQGFLISEPLDEDAAIMFLEK